ncbi:zinc finger protein 233-like isoform X2 [Chironomus tepperi]|uniref:zinc finger protein 233-like isoform X2 n=1 Tax=Chironomus tepperi TaxID=113505 RepID=UPI00391EE4BC
MNTKKNVLVGCTGSIAAIKLPVVLNLLKKRDPTFQIRVVLTERAKHFVNINEISSMAEVFTDQSEWHITKGLNEQSLHLELVQWADIFIISPMDANTLGKISSGICDNLLTCVARAWDLHKPLLFCPEMNTKMFLHPITSKQIEELKIYGYYELPSISETLLTDSSGAGALSEINYIIDSIFNHVQQLQHQAQMHSNDGDSTMEPFEQKYNHHMQNKYASQSSTPSVSPTSVVPHMSGFVQVKQRAQHGNPATKPFTCDICGGKFSRYSSLWSHKTLHTGIKKFVCTICNASFAKANYLNNHKRTHTGEKPYRCSTCGQSFAQSTHLKNHERIHSGEKPFTCEVCHKDFARYSTLWNHRRIHTGEKPYKCSWCSSAFSQATHLRKHEKVHLGIKPFKCEVCSSSFADRFALQRHSKTHLKTEHGICS